MRKKRFNKQLLNEEINKFRMLSEYMFWEDTTEIEPLEKGQKILYGELTKEAEEEEEESTEEEGGEESTEEEGGEGEALDIPDDEIEMPGEEKEEEGGEGEEDPFGSEGEEDASDEVELDVTELVKGSEEAKASADAANAKIDQLMGMVNNLTSQLDSMDAISNKIDDLEGELEKRAPTPEEKIEMRSLDSYPYNLKLTDFWSNQKNQYDVIPDEKKEYVLDKDAIESDYSDVKAKDSLDMDNEYEEEDF